MPKREETRNLRLHGTWIWDIVCIVLIRTMFANPILWIEPDIEPMFTGDFMESAGCAGLDSLRNLAPCTSPPRSPHIPPAPSSQWWGWHMDEDTMDGHLPPTFEREIGG
jgi:hypothetical protein